MPHSLKMTHRKLPREFYTRANVLTVPRQLLGQVLVVRVQDGTRASGVIVETEAYRGPQDRASHAYGGRRTNRTETMSQVGGTAYVYFVYGMYCQFNVVTNVNEIPHAVLVRALGIDRTLDQADLLCERVWIEAGASRIPPSEIASGPRIGVDYAEEWAEKPWRFWIRNNPFVSRRDNPARNLKRQGGQS